MDSPFLLLAAVTLFAACSAMLLRSLVHCALALAVTFTGIGALYLNLGAQFLGLAQLLVYVGAVAVLIVFVILLTREADTDEPLLSPIRRPLAGASVALGVFAVLAWALLHSAVAHAPTSDAPSITMRALGSGLMRGYVFPLEVIGLMLTAALIGAVIVAMKEKPGPQ